MTDTFPDTQWKTYPMVGAKKGNKFRGNLGFTASYSIAKDSKHKAQAFKMLQFLESPVGQKIWIGNVGYLPSRSDVKPPAGRGVFTAEAPYTHPWQFAPGFSKVLQNRAGGFRIQPGHPNCIAPGKRPLHTIIPSLATKNGRALMPFGVMGGQYQPVGQTRVLTNMLDYGCDVQEAIDMPRGLHYEGVYQLEDSVPAEIVEGLKKIGHKTSSVVGPLGGGQAIWIDWDKGTLTGGSDPRKDGCALGY